ncbi:MAG: CDP-diacylglycerol--glycerol-3-phosphate 3-phosphatidyltransferase [Planctomycetota bacterium]
MTKATTTANGGTEKRSTILTIPNQLTLARLVLAVIFFALLACFGHGLFGNSRATTLNWAMGLFILAVSTDFLDGYLARRWGMVSTFGRIADPFADKIIICGSFIMLIEISDFVHAWFAVVILFREFLVSGLRSFLESRGIEFGALLSGKLKMVFQSVTIPTVLFYEANFHEDSVSPLKDVTQLETTIFYLALITLTLTLLATLASCSSYVRRGITALSSHPGST